MADLQSKYLFIASMDIDPDREALFNEVYNTEHCLCSTRPPASLASLVTKLTAFLWRWAARFRKLRSQARPSTTRSTKSRARKY